MVVKREGHKLIDYRLIIFFIYFISYAEAQPCTGQFKNNACENVGFTSDKSGTQIKEYGLNDMREITYYLKKIKSLGLKESLSLGYKRLINSSCPRVINVEIMNKCNLKCEHCRVTYHGGLMGDVTPEFMEFDSFRNIIDRISPLIKKAESFQFSTVEPLFHKDLFKMMDYVTERNKSIRYPLLSNGMLLTENNIEQLLKRNIPTIAVSLDGYTKKTVESFKTNTNFDRVVENIKCLTTLCKDKIDVSVVFVATKENIEELETYIGFCKSLNVNRILVNGFMSFLPENSHLYLYSKQGNPKVRSIFQRAYQEAKKHNIDIEFPSLITEPEGCGLHSYMNINEKGDVSPCILLARQTPFELFSKTNTAEPIVYGNIFKDTPLSIWNSKKATEFRNKLKNRKVPQECCLCPDAYGVICSNRDTKI